MLVRSLMPFGRQLWLLQSNSGLSDCVTLTGERGQEGAGEVDFYLEKAGGEGQRIKGSSSEMEKSGGGGRLRMGKVCTCSSAEGMERVGTSTEE